VTSLAQVLAAFSSGRLSGTAAWFADDAVYQEKDRSVVRGRAAIAEHFRQFGASGRAWKFIVEDVLRDGERACVVYRFAVAGGEGEPWRERDGCATVRFDKGGLIAEWREYQG
jgi:ketosteroid isomerase-like protein